MKKHWTMRVAVLMVALTLITSCFVSGTYAKYVTTGSATDSARVAKWGVEVTATGKAFGAAYVSSTGKISASYAAATDSVNAFNGTDKLVAPGTGDDVATITLTGRPEVDVRVTTVATITLTGWTYDDDDDAGTPEVEYCPIVFTVNGATYGTNDSNATNKSATVAALAAAVKAAIEALNQDYEANTNLASVSQPILPISWAWPFEVGADAAAIAAHDAKDTALGNKAANGSAATISIQLDTTVTQLD